MCSLYHKLFNKSTLYEHLFVLNVVTELRQPFIRSILTPSHPIS
uniref:Uncharacterized protein n=1 Tax=Siphoviridae sp. ctTIi48 TaxID=2827875 RepID=A0A8S5TLE6_9CAUD|nr:MAG TPA: hypothetical protein [Siphoviridae sp. ctTIi48]